VTGARAKQPWPPAHPPITWHRRLISAALVASIVLSGVLLTAPAASAAGRRCSSTPFRSSPAAHRWFRIPGIVKTRNSTLVAFAERRDRELGDLGDFDVVTARSTDRGCHWSAYRVIGNDGSSRVSNPVPMIDATTGNILVFSVVTPRSTSARGKGLYLQTSSDDGRTFSALLNHPVRPLGHYKGGLTGPGHGIQLTVTHPGRLILPLGYRTTSGFYGAYGIYSDDHGSTWRTGFDQQDTSGKNDFMEGTIAELPTGKLFISYRLKHDLAKAGTARQYAISSDGGASLSQHFTRLPLNIVSVQGSALAPVGPHRGQLLFSAPADTTRNLRRDMSVFVSTTGGRSWGRHYQVELESTPGSYSDLVQLDTKTVGILYETGKKKWKERIAFESLAIPALTQTALAPARMTFHRPATPIKDTTRATVRVRVTVRGIKHPPGRVTLAYAGSGRSGSASARLTYSTRGVRSITLPRLHRGKYRLVLHYSGYARIRKLTQHAGILRVIKS
jgi:sialidase-1